jgi:FkbM family methyltransferase
MIIKFVKRFFGFFGFRILRESSFSKLQENQRHWGWRLEAFIQGELDKGLGGFATKNSFKNYRSQLGQDYVAQQIFGDKGFFVEFGATNGVELSNSFALEQMGWHGILAEPSRKWHEQLVKNRPDAYICKKCVWSQSGENLEFFEATAGVLSTVASLIENDHHVRVKEDSYYVETISLKDLLDEADAPKFIEFLSIDTEGSEFEILESFDWDSYSFGFIAVEHNYTNQRERIHSLLAQHGFIRILENNSKWDDWYINQTLHL